MLDKTQDELLKSLANRLTDKPPMEYTSEILNERQKTHGSFDDNARLCQRFRSFLRAEPGWDKLSDTQREALDMIAHKMARILAGDPNFKDHWTDICGYSKLIEERCNG